MFLLVVDSMKVNFVELLFTCIKRKKENIKMNTMNDAIKPELKFLYVKKKTSRIRNPRGDFMFLFLP